MKALLQRLKHIVNQSLDFQSRVWVVNVFTDENKGESFIVNEDSFNQPMDWMKRKGYSDAMIEQVNRMQRSQVREFQLGEVKHRLMRVK